MASITIDNVRKSYGTLQVVHGVSLDIADGSFVVLLGPSGCGKSTLLRMIAGLETVTAGDIRIGPRLINNVHPKDRNIAMVFQNYALYAHMSVFDNMAFSLKLKKMPRPDIETKVKWAASILGLDPYLDRFPRQLSGGQRQRVSMGRAIVRDPAVFLFDEPLSNLDAKLRVQMRTEIKELHQRLKTTTVYVTHDQIEAMTMADVIVILKDGRIEQQGRPLDIYDHPANLFVAEFIGSPSMNLLRGEVEGVDGRPALRLPDGIALPLPADVAVKTGQKLVYGIRPEHLRPTGSDGLSAKVNVVEPTGPEMHIYADIGTQEVCAITSDRLDLKMGDRLTLAPAAGRIHLFDQDAGARSMADIAILGAGVMGSAMSVPAAAMGHTIALVGTHLDQDIVRSVAGNGHHPRLGLALPASVTAHEWSAFGAVMAGRPDLLVLGVASAGVEWAIQRIVESVTRPVPVLMITKGLSPTGDTIEALPRIVRREVKARCGLDLDIMAVAGPCIAGELAAGRDTSVVVTGDDPALIERVVGLVGAPFYHARRSADVVGVEVCAAFKNFYALAVGWANGRLERDGKGPNGALMHNLAAGLFAQALVEMGILVEVLGGTRESVFGLPGAGDLYVTCLAGRNSRMGRLLGLGHRYGEAKAGFMAQDTVEGAELALALGPTFERMILSGRLPGERMPLLGAVLDTVCHDRQMSVDWTRFYQ